MTCSQPVHGSKQPIRGCSAPSPNWMANWSNIINDLDLRMRIHEFSIFSNKMN
uniref:Uncharacterized protein n=1 Tax=Vitis vinifera TaxID=29760 RepID=F6HVZ8_VITVI